MTKVLNVVLVLPEGDQTDLEIAFEKFMNKRAIDDPNFPLENPWGEYYIQQGKILHGIQWSYVGIEQWEPDGPWEYEDGYTAEDIECEVQCSWHENDNYG